MATWRGGSGTPPGIDLCLAALHRRGIAGTMAVVGVFRAAHPDFEWSDSMIKSMLNGTREPKPEFVHRLAGLAEVPATQVFAQLGWLSPEEVAQPSVPHLLRQLRSGISAAGQLALDGTEPWADRAAPAAAAAVLEGEHGAARFNVSLSAVECGDRYRCALMDVAEFSLRAGAEPLELDRAVSLADSRSLREALFTAHRKEAVEHPEYWSVRVELTALTHRALRHRGEYSWQGQPGARMWLDPSDGHRPRHLLVQDRVAGVPSGAVPAAAARCAERGVAPLVVIGHRPLAGGAAALLAQALGLQYVLPRSGEEILTDGVFIPVLRSPLQGRMEAWLSVVGHLRDRAAAGDPWPAVVLTRPYVFDATVQGAEPALRELRDLPAHVACIRPAVAMLRWWAERRAASDPSGLFDVEAWVHSVLGVYERIEEALRARPAEGTLLIQVPEPDVPLPVGGRGWPDAVVDLQPRLAWTMLNWLDLTVNRSGPKFSGRLQPGLLAEWAPTLRNDSGVSALMAR